MAVQIYWTKLNPHNLCYCDVYHLVHVSEQEAPDVSFKKRIEVARNYRQQLITGQLPGCIPQFEQGWLRIDIGYDADN
ncbi:MAG: hypothetical protein ABR574_09050 [Cryomorphaceae bacterium]